MMAEWFGYDQIQLFGICTILGAGLGLLFSFFNVASKFRSRRGILFVCDTLFCVVASVVTFFFSLATMDARLHPLLFGGCAVGFVTFHITVGRPLSRWLYLLGRSLVSVARCIVGWIFVPFRSIFVIIRRAISAFCIQREKKAKKSRKKSTFFQKNS